MTILVTAVSGPYGRLVVESLLERGAAPHEIVATARDASKIADLAERGIRTAVLDYDRPDTIAAALEGVDRVLLVSGSVPVARVAGHRNVIDAAAAAGVELLAYTSMTNATSAVDFPIAADHVATEQAIAASGLPAVILRNAWYTENAVADVERAATTGVIVSSTGDGRIASATRADLADAAAVVLLGDGHAGTILELGGDTAWTREELAAVASDLLGRAVTHTNLTTAEHVAALEAAGLDAGTAAFVAGIDDAIRRDSVAFTDGTLSRLIGRPTTSLRDGLRAAMAVPTA